MAGASPCGRSWEYWVCRPTSPAFTRLSHRASLAAMLDLMSEQCSWYRSAVCAFLSWYEQENLEPFDPKHVTPIDLIGYRNQLQQQASTSTVNVHVCAMRSFCAWLVEMKTIDSN